MNDQFAESPPAEFGLIGYVPEPWRPADCIAIGKIMSIVDMDETQGWIRKLIVQMVQKGVTPAMLREVFTYMTEEPDEDYLDKLRQVRIPDPYVPETVKWAIIPREKTSSHWMLAGSRTDTGKPILCGSPELDTARLPALWQEVLSTPATSLHGRLHPGIPLPALGRTETLSTPPTAVGRHEYFLEEVAGGKPVVATSGALRGAGGSHQGSKDAEPVTVRYYGNVTGCWRRSGGDGIIRLAISPRSGAGTFADFSRHYAAATVEESMDHFPERSSAQRGPADSSGASATR